MSKHTTRRNVLKGLAMSGSAMLTAPLVTSTCAATNPEKKMLKGNVNHSVCRWTYSTYSVEDLCKHVKEIGFAAIDLVGPADWPTLKKYGIFSSMCNGAEISINDGWNNKQFHPTLLKNYADNIDLVSKAGYKNLICFSGARKGMDDETGLKNCAEGLKQIMSQAEKQGVIVQMELLNSKVNHKDYMCDRSAWGVELCKRIGSPNFKLLYDIYHMQIDEGDVIRTIRDNHQYFGHYHTGGVPGRNEIDETQELYYPAIVKCIFDELKFTGYLAQEFIPARQDKIASLRQAIHICDV